VSRALQTLQGRRLSECHNPDGLSTGLGANPQHETPGAVVDLVVVVLALLGFHAPALCTCAITLAA